MTIIDDIVTALQASGADRKKFVDIIRLATNQIEAQEQAAAEAVRQTNITNATNWYNGEVQPKLSNPTTRTIALNNYNIIKSYLSETDVYRKRIVEIKLAEMEQIFKDRKANG